MRCPEGITEPESYVARARSPLCVYCGGKSETKDHVIPASRGGTNKELNLISCCSPCNQEKADGVPAGWEGYVWQWPTPRVALMRLIDKARRESPDPTIVLTFSSARVLNGGPPEKRLSVKWMNEKRPGEGREEVP